MLAGALTYGFALLGKRPVTILACLFVGLMVVGFVDYLFINVPAFRLLTPAEPLRYMLGRMAFIVLRAVVGAIPNAVALVTALSLLGVRDGRATLGDCLRTAAVTLMYVAVFVAPLSALQVVLTSRFASMPLPFADVGLAVLAFVLQSYLLIRFGMAWPHTITTRRYALFKSWSLTRGRFWRLAGILVPALLLDMLIVWAGQYLNASIFRLTGGGLDASGLEWPVNVINIEGSRILGAFFLACANVYLYAKLIAPAPSVVHHFE